MTSFVRPEVLARLEELSARFADQDELEAEHRDCRTHDDVDEAQAAGFIEGYQEARAECEQQERGWRKLFRRRMVQIEIDITPRHHHRDLG